MSNKPFEQESLIVTSRGMLKIPGLSEFVGKPVQYLSIKKKYSSKYIAGWGRKNSFFKAQQYSKQYQYTLLCLEDGFIRSLGLGKNGVPPLSIVVDRIGIYFDATAPSDLENIILAEENLQKNKRAIAVIAQIQKYGISKYNLKYAKLDITQFVGKQVLIVDQTYGDQSIAYAMATPQTFQQMLRTALKKHPEATIWIKTHPDVVSGKAKGHFDISLCQKYPNIKICSEYYHPYQFLSYFDDVYVVSSQFGFEALLAGKKVHCFGLPWYAGWGLTNDEHAPVDKLHGRRQCQRSLAHLFACAYFDYARYISPITQQRCDLEDIIELLIVNILEQQVLEQNINAVKFSRWKRQFLQQFLNFPTVKVDFLNWSKPQVDSAILVWGKNAQRFRQQEYTKVCTVEDGFIRSTGLGANLIRPYSLVFDTTGIYYDATQLSGLEIILNRIQLNSKQIVRTEKLIAQLIALSITKYNVGKHHKLLRPQNAEKVILVTGQVEDDVSVQLGGLDIKTNVALLCQVRLLNPEAYIIYKPHPDVQSGLRIGRIAEEQVYQYANQIELEASILTCFEIIDELHTISSLSGFEALLRGKKVYCYGMPFYAGWGLTVDALPCLRRKKTLQLVELVYGVLVEYASYNLPQTEIFKLPRVNVEDVINQLYFEIQQGKTSPKLQSLFSRLRAIIVYGKKKI